MSILQSKRYNPNSVYSSGGLPPPRLSTYVARDDPWDARASMDDLKKEEMAGEYGYDQAYAPGGMGYGAGASHGQGQGYGQEAYGYGAQPGMNAHGAQGQGYNDGRYDDAQQYGQQQQYQQGYDYRHPETPEQAMYGREPGPTPEMNRYSQGEGVGYQHGGLQRPEGAQSHPGMVCSPSNGDAYKRKLDTDTQRTSRS